MQVQVEDDRNELQIITGNSCKSSPTLFLAKVSMVNPGGPEAKFEVTSHGNNQNMFLWFVVHEHTADLDWLFWLYDPHYGADNNAFETVAGVNWEL